ncbi:MAG: glycosyltransferase family 4 protein [Bacteroidia bacterium]
MKRVLVITYYWPPSGGAGVQRWLKFVKYLPQFGIEPIVLTVDANVAAYPVMDATLCAEVAKETKVFTTQATDYFKWYRKFTGKKELPTGGIGPAHDRSFKHKLMAFIRGNFMLPDPRKGWNSFAYKKAVQLIRDLNIDTVITTSPPHSTQLIGLKLKQQLHIRWIADLRDPWTDIYYYNQFYHTPLAKWMDKNYERTVVENADKIITVSADLARIYASKTTKNISEKIHIIPNGFDETDFESAQPQTDVEPNITYTGTLSDEYPLHGFITALQELGSDVKLRFVGKISQSQQEGLAKTPSKIEYISHVPHRQSIEFLQQAGILLLVIPQVENNKGIITGKFFEYLASGKPVLAIGPVDGDLADLIKETQCGKIFDYSDVHGIKRYIELHNNAKNTCIINERGLLYSRKNLSGILAKIINY